MVGFYPKMYVRLVYAFLIPEAVTLVLPLSPQTPQIDPLHFLHTFTMSMFNGHESHDLEGGGGGESTSTSSTCTVYTLQGELDSPAGT